MSFDKTPYLVTGSNNANKQVSVTYQNAMLGALETSINVGSGTATWGSVTGTLSNQSDLQTALNAKLTAASNLSDVANAATARSNLGLTIGTHVQAYDADLTTYASITPSANVQTLLGAADFAAFRTSLSLVIGTNVQAFDADLSTLAANITAFGHSLVDDANAAAGRTTLELGTIATQAANNVSITGGSITGITDLALADGGTGASLVDPAADRLLFWDDSESTMAWLSLHGNLEISGTTLKPKHRGALVRNSADLTGHNYAAGGMIPFNSEDRDTDSCHPISSTVTITIASPGVVTWTGHTLTAGSPVVFTTTGALPTGLTAGTTYWIVSPAANTFQVSATPGGSAINTSGSQSGTHTATNYSGLVTPAGVTLVKLGCELRFANVAANNNVFATLRKNGATATPGAAGMIQTDNATPRIGAFWSPVLDSTAGDRWEVHLITVDTSIDITANVSWFAMEIIE